MNIIICLDDKNGICFNGRRQSRDRVVCERILSVTEGALLWMSEYSAKIFSSDKTKADDRYLTLAAEDEYCFAENSDFLQYADRFQRVIIYRWNRVYPSDEKIDPVFLDGKKLISKTDLRGNSHEKITEEIYE